MIKNRRYVPIDTLRKFAIMYDSGDMYLRKLVDAWYVAQSQDELEMIELQIELYKEEKEDGRTLH